MSNIAGSRWTPDLVERLLAAVARMASDPEIHFADVAAELGLGRHMVIGKVERLRRKGYPIPNFSDRVRRPSMPKPHRPRVKPVTLATVPPTDEYEPLSDAQPAEPPAHTRKHMPKAFLCFDPPAPPEPATYTLLDLDWRQCRWPINDGVPQFLFCGAPTSRWPYCVQHRRIAHAGRWP